MSTAVEATAAKGETEVEALRRLLAKVQAEKDEAEAKLQEAQDQAVARYTLRVSDKGGISVYGIRRFPLTFYWEEWEKIFSLMDKITAFYQKNKALVQSRAAATRAANGK